MARIFPKLHDEFRAALERLLAAWFPAALDPECGGYYCDLDYRWRPRGPQEKLLEFQARTLRVAARAALGKPELAPAAASGLRFLADRMWDAELGGFYRLVDRNGAPLDHARKHSHGTAYAISACCWQHIATGEAEPLDLAMQAFDWLDRTAHDETLGGYYSYLQRDGSRVPARSEVLDPLGNPIAGKEGNTTADLLDALSTLHDISQDARVRARLAELLEITSNKIVSPADLVHLAFSDDWRPYPGLSSYALTLQTSSLMIGASRSLDGTPAGGVVSHAERMVRACVRVALDRKTGAFAYAGGAFGRVHLANEVAYVGSKVWWAQAEALRAMAVINRWSADSPFEDEAAALWRFVREKIENRHGGWDEFSRDSPGHTRRSPQAHIWKDPSHECQMLMELIGPPYRPVLT